MIPVGIISIEHPDVFLSLAEMLNETVTSAGTKPNFLSDLIFDISFRAVTIFFKASKRVINTGRTIFVIPQM